MNSDKTRSPSLFIIYLVILGTFFNTLYASPLNTKRLTLKSAVETAVNNNPGLAEIHSRYKALKEIPSQVKSLPDPMINIGAMNFPTDTFSRTQEAMTNIQLGFTQEFPYPGKLDIRGEIAEFEVDAALYTVDEIRLSLISSVEKRWWQTYYFDRALETIAKNKNLLRQFINIAETKYKTGRGLQQDVLLAQLELSKLTDQEIQLVALRRVQEINLNILMGKSPDGKIKLSKKRIKRLSRKLNEKALFNLAQTYRPVLKVKESRVSVANSKLALARKDYYPDFKVSVAYGDRSGYNPGSFIDPRADLFSVNVGIKVPLYYKNKQSKAEQQRFIEEQGSQYALEDEKLRVMAEISESYTDYREAQKQFQLFKTGILPQAKQTVDSMLSGYQVSKVDFLNLVRSQVTLYNYELLYWKALTASMQALAQIQANVGKVDIYE